MLKALIHVQHLLGIGHAVRAAAIGRALADCQVSVTLVTGNHLPDVIDTGGLDVEALSAARAADVMFSRLVDDDGDPVDEAWKEKRKAHLLSIHARIRPDMILTEFFPLGRRKFRFELIPLLESAMTQQPRPVIASAVRDILVPKDKARTERWMADTALQYYDRLLVHGEKEMIGLDATFRYASELEHLISYTGYVHGAARATEPPPGDGEDEIIVACGGGAVGESLLRAAAGATSQFGAHPWRILTGRDVPEAVLGDVATLAGAAGCPVIVEPARRDFPHLLKRARLVIAQAGYNTVTDILAAGVSAVLVPFAQGRESEQTLRAEALAGSGRAIMISETGLTPERLAAAVTDALDLPKRWPHVSMDGAARSAEILIDLARKRESGQP